MEKRIKRFAVIIMAFILMLPVFATAAVGDILTMKDKSKTDEALAELIKDNDTKGNLSLKADKDKL